MNSIQIYRGINAILDGVANGTITAEDAERKIAALQQQANRNGLGIEINISASDLRDSALKPYETSFQSS
jgi:hypothetical protein